MPKRRSAPAATLPEPVESSSAGADGVEERGAFAFARCATCGWQGAGRRSRARARQDLMHHLQDQPQHAAHAVVEVEVVGVVEVGVDEPAER